MILERSGAGSAHGQNSARGQGACGLRRLAAAGHAAAGGAAATVCTVAAIDVCTCVALRFALQHAGYILLHHKMEIGAAKAIGADACAPRRALGRVPLLEFMVQVERGLRKIDVGVGLLRVERGRQHLVVNGHGRLEQTGCACARLEVANIALGRTQCNRTGTRAGAKHFGEAFHLNHITHTRACAMRFHQRGAGGFQARVFPRALDGEQLSLRVGRGNTLALAVAGACDTADNGVDLVAVALGVGQPLEQERAAAFTHDEAIGSRTKGAAARSAQRTDFAELDEARCAHVAVHAACDHGIGLPGIERLTRGLHGSKRGCAGSVGNEVGAAQIEYIGHAPGHNVG